MKYNFTLAESCNFEDYPFGGSLSFSKQLMKVYPNICLIGITTSSLEPVGEWFTKKINGIEYPYFAFMRVKNKTNKKTIIPFRLKCYLSLLLYKNKILSGTLSKNLFTQSPQVFLALADCNWKSICYCFAGISNSVAISRYPYLRFLGSYYENYLFRKLKFKADLILAAASGEAISEAVKRTNVLSIDKIISFPTRYDNTIFYPMSIYEARKKLELNQKSKYIVVVGRLSWVKGGELVLEIMERILEKQDNFRLIFVGDGEDKEKLKLIVNNKNLSKYVDFTGRKEAKSVALYINAADYIVQASYMEGWPTTLVEAVACGKVLISTNTSGVSELIRNGENGFIINSRDPEAFTQAILTSKMPTEFNEFSIRISKQYSIDSLKNDLDKLWNYEKLKSN